MGVRNHWLSVKLIGTKSNRDGFGARLEAVAGDFHQYTEAPQRTVIFPRATRGHTSAWASTQEVDKLIIHWPSGIDQELDHIKADQFLTVKEPAETPTGTGGKGR